MITVIFLYPGRDPLLKKIDPSEVLDCLEGPCEIIWPLELEVGIVRQVKPQDQSVNRCICDTYTRVFMELRGPVMLVGTHGDEGYSDLTEDEIRVLLSQFT